MGTENLQKLSNKRSTKTIHFTDHSIEKFKPTIKTKRVKVGFPRNSITNGVKIVYWKNIQEKYWELTYFLKKKKKGAKIL